MTNPSRDRLVKICGLLGSSSDGERANAAAKASALAGQLGGWANLLSPEPRQAAIVRPPQPVRSTGDHTRLAQMMARRSELLTAWEQGFVASVARARRLTPAQRAKLEDICNVFSERLRQAERAAA